MIEDEEEVRIHLKQLQQELEQKDENLSNPESVELFLPLLEEYAKYGAFGDNFQQLEYMAKMFLRVKEKAGIDGEYGVYTPHYIGTAKFYNHHLRLKKYLWISYFGRNKNGPAKIARLEYYRTYNNQKQKIIDKIIDHIKSVSKSKDQSKEKNWFIDGINFLIDDTNPIENEILHYSKCVMNDPEYIECSSYYLLKENYEDAKKLALQTAKEDAIINRGYVGLIYSGFANLLKQKSKFNLKYDNWNVGMEQVQKAIIHFYEKSIPFLEKNKQLKFLEQICGELCSQYLLVDKKKSMKLFHDRLNIVNNLKIEYDDNDIIEIWLNYLEALKGKTNGIENVCEKLVTDLEKKFNSSIETGSYFAISSIFRFKQQKRLYNLILTFTDRQSPDNSDKTYRESLRNIQQEIDERELYRRRRGH